MSSTIDANVLLYASDTSAAAHAAAREFLGRWAGGPGLVYLFWPTVMAYLRIATHPSIFESPLDAAVARANIDSLVSLPHVRTGGEDDAFWRTWQDVTAGMPVRGNLVPDSHLVALMRQYGVDTIWSRDRDFRKFDGIKVRDPLAADVSGAGGV